MYVSKPFSKSNSSWKGYRKSDVKTEGKNVSDVAKGKQVADSNEKPKTE